MDKKKEKREYFLYTVFFMDKSDTLVRVYDKPISTKEILLELKEKFPKGFTSQQGGRYLKKYSWIGQFKLASDLFSELYDLKLLKRRAYLNEVIEGRYTKKRYLWFVNQEYIASIILEKEMSEIIKKLAKEGYIINFIKNDRYMKSKQSGW